ncbi:MAG: ATP-binding protein [Erythrobacter sp.]
MPTPAEILENLVCATLLIDPSNTVMRANPAAEHMLGLSAPRLLGRTIDDALGPFSQAVARRIDETDAALVAREIIVAARPAAIRVDLTMSPITGSAGWRVVTLTPYGHTDAESTAPAASGLAAPSILAHEIKNPLAAIRGAAQLAGRKLASPDKPLAQMIVAEVDRIAALIDRMQQLGSSASHEAEPCNAHEALRGACALVCAAGRKTGRVDEAFDPSLPPMLAPRATLEQVLVNLIANAMDAASARADAVITLHTRFAGGQMLSAVHVDRTVSLPIELTVSDNGPGIDPALADTIFEPFVTSKPFGEGLGLALVRKLVRDMGGRVSHDRDHEACLTHFRLHLPRAAVESGA